MMHVSGRMDATISMRLSVMALWLGLFFWSPPQGMALDVASNVHEYVLSNGLKVLLVESPKAPVVTVQIWY
jgi:hypothetical protein